MRMLPAACIACGDGPCTLKGNRMVYMPVARLDWLLLQCCVAYCETSHRMR